MSGPVRVGRPDADLRVLAVCTGNVARSVMLGVMLGALAEERGASWTVRTAGTHAGEGQSISARTKNALLTLPALSGRDLRHASRALRAEDLSWADLALCVEADQVRFARMLAPAAAVVQLRELVDAPGATLHQRLAVLTTREPDTRDDVADPAGGDQDAYDRCAADLWDLARRFADLAGA